jgi:hypothetical protein
MKSLCVASMVRNEADSYLESAVKAWWEFADEIVVLDDGSSDDTADLCQDLGCSVYRWDGPQAWGTETPVRMALWDLAVRSDHDYIMILDADQVPAMSPRPLLAEAVELVGFPIFDLWGTECYREDRFWRGHEGHHSQLFRNPRTIEGDKWSGRGIHSGHYPMNFDLTNCITEAPIEHSILHYAYVDPADRMLKAKQYFSQAHQLSPGEQAHAISIVDPSPSTFPLEVKVTWPLTKRTGGLK